MAYRVRLLALELFPPWSSHNYPASSPTTQTAHSLPDCGTLQLICALAHAAPPSWNAHSVCPLLSSLTTWCTLLTPTTPTPNQPSLPRFGGGSLSLLHGSHQCPFLPIKWQGARGLSLTRGCTNSSILTHRWGQVSVLMAQQFQCCTTLSEIHTEWL